MTDYDETTRRVYNCIRGQTNAVQGEWTSVEQVKVILGTAGFDPGDIQQALDELVRDELLQADDGEYHPVDADYRIPYPGEINTAMR